jgi:uncharacterized Ntn-hydrolase superfamily protein
MTYSILGFDPETREISCAVQSKFPGVGTIVLHGSIDAGCIATQAFSDPTHGTRGLALLQQGATPSEVIDILTRDDETIAQRQIAVLNKTGETAAYTGEDVKSWEGYAGSASGKRCIAHGNALTSDKVPSVMIEAFEVTSGEISERLIAALRAGRDAGGELRGQQSAALLVFKEGGGYGGKDGRHVDISIYDHKEPIEELARCYKLHRLAYFPSREEDLIPITAELAKELKSILQRKGYTALSDGTDWKQQDIETFARFMGMENYDNRIRDDARIDKEVLEDIRQKANV